MLLFSSSIFFILLGNLFIKNPPKQKNYFYGFRTKKSMKNQKNWNKSQVIYGQYTQCFFKYIFYVSLIFLILDIYGIIISQNIIFWSTIIQSILLCILLFFINFLVNKKLN
ncbi:SdpI family protein [Staphylococcus hominis]|uniref:SdpI family protein n=1 Tax=Staphylococcus hominis TaxID=1290 RepID=UPI002413BD1D|nr:SdpI family protein [Staphylococcus hominis]